MSAPVCDTCKDTHTMTLHVGFDEREVMCTFCPVPCQRCRTGGYGAYCAQTPCACTCHVRDKLASVRRAIEERDDWERGLL